MIIWSKIRTSKKKNVDGDDVVWKRKEIWKVIFHKGRYITSETKNDKKNVKKENYGMKTLIKVNAAANLWDKPFDDRSKQIVWII